MYESFYGLSVNPFQISTDPSFLWLGEKHREAISMLKYGIQRSGHTGILLLTGDVGTGKTTLINTLFASLGPEIIRVSVKNPSLTPIEFFNHLVNCFGGKKSFNSKNEFLREFETFLHNARQKGRKVLLVIDEAQLLDDELLQEVRLLSNMETDEGQSLMVTFLVGQPEVRENLATAQNRPLVQRITLNHHIDAFTLSETRDYIQHRLEVSGATEALFSEDAISVVHKHSQGLPRQINVICDNALLTGYVRGAQEISSEIVWSCLDDFSIARVPTHKPAKAVPAHEAEIDLPMDHPETPPPGYIPSHATADEDTGAYYPRENLAPEEAEPYQDGYPRPSATERVGPQRNWLYFSLIMVLIFAALYYGSRIFV